MPPPTTIRRKKKQQLEQFNFLVAGPSRLGKTAFLRTLFATLHSTTPTDEVPFPLSPTSTITTHTMVVSEGRSRFALTLVDTPGFVDDGTVHQQAQLLLTFIENHFELRLIEESRVKRDPHALHHQLHACIYFLDPVHNGLRPSDVMVMQQLSRRVNVIPVIAKADTLTCTRLEGMKKAVRRDIRKHKLHVYAFPDWERSDDEDEDEEKEVSAKAGEFESGKQLRALVPFAVVTNDEEDQGEDGEMDSDWEELYEPEDDVDGEEEQAKKRVDRMRVKREPKPELGRRFPWGNVDITNGDHCDFIPLRNAVLVTHRRTLRDITEETLYEHYRTERMKERRASMLAMRRSSKHKGELDMGGMTIQE